jgi:F-type H+-transporting ATPase subunit b
MPEFLHDPEVWVAVAFVIAVGLIWWQGAGKIAGMLDARAAGIKADLDAARRLRDEAATLLAEYQQRQREALGVVKEIAARAVTDTERLAAESRRDLELALTRREAQARDRIAQAEAAAISEVRGVAVDVAIGAARRLIAESLDAERGGALIDDAIRALPPSLH